MANRLVSLEECGKRSRSAEPSATLKKQSGINGLLPSLASLGGPLHLFRLLLDLCSRFSNRVAVTFPQYVYSEVFDLKPTSGSESVPTRNCRFSLVRCRRNRVTLSPNPLGFVALGLLRQGRPRKPVGCP